MPRPSTYILTADLPPLPNKRYFTIGEVSQCCDVRSYVLRYWEQEFEHLRPMKRRGNRRYYQLHEVQLVRSIRTLLYEQGYSIAEARERVSALLGAAVAMNEADEDNELPNELWDNNGDNMADDNNEAVADDHIEPIESTTPNNTFIPASANTATISTRALHYSEIAHELQTILRMLQT